MRARFAFPHFAFLTLLALGLRHSTGAEPPAANDPPAATPGAEAESAKIARPATTLAGKLVRVRPPADRTVPGDLLDKVDLANDVFYTTTEDPVPEARQFQFVDGVLRTPAEGDARLYLPVEVPGIYRLSLDVVDKPEAKESAIGIGALLDGHRFMLELDSDMLTLGRFYDRVIAKPWINRVRPDSPLANSGVDLLVGDCGFLARYRLGMLEWPAPGVALSLDEKWAAATDRKLFLVFPNGQVDLRSVVLEPLEREQWLQLVARLAPQGDIVSFHANAEPAKIDFDADPLPDRAVIKPATLRLAQSGDFDELERWADRLRTGELVIENRFGSEEFYEWIGDAFVKASPSGTHGALEAYFQAQFAFLEAWLKQKPDSVAARIVKARCYISYAWDARGGGFADTVPATAWLPFKERLEVAEGILNETAQIQPPDVCVFSTMLAAGRGLGWSPRQLQRTVERGLQVSKKDFILIDMMVNNLLPRWGGQPGDLGKFAMQMDKRVGGDEGLDIYARVAKTTQGAEVSLLRSSGDPEAFGTHNLGYTDPAVVLQEFDADKLRAAIPVVRERHPKSKSGMNHICWLSCVLDDKATAKELFAEILDRPDVHIWGSRDRFDHWRHWCDPDVAEPSQFLPVEGKELAHLQPYGEKAAKVEFMLDNETLITGTALPAATIKYWDLAGQRITHQVEPPEDLGKLFDLWLLDSGQLFVPMASEKKLVMVLYQPPTYDRGAYPADFFGMPFNLISDDGQAAAVLTHDKAFVGNVRLKKQQTIAVPRLKSAGLSSNGKYLAGMADKLYVWDCVTGKQLFSVDVQPTSMNFMRDNTGIVYCTDKELVVLNLPDQFKRYSIPLGPQHVITSFRTTTDGRFLAAAERLKEDAGSDERYVVAVYDFKQTTPIHVFDPHKKPIAELAISRDGSRLASSSEDGVVKVWNLLDATTKPVEPKATEKVKTKKAAAK